MGSKTIEKWLKIVLFWSVIAGVVNINARLFYWTQYLGWRLDRSPLYYLWDAFNELSFDNKLNVHFVGGIMTVIALLVFVAIFELAAWCFDGSESEIEEEEQSNQEEPEDDEPSCTNEFCRCRSHGPEEFRDGEWQIAECNDPDCFCIDYHPDREITDQTFMNPATVSS